jgi:hypothetical protein
MHGGGKSDDPVVPANLPNKAAAAEVGEERGSAKGNTASKTPPGHSAGYEASSALERVREVARRVKKARFTACCTTSTSNDSAGPTGRSAPRPHREWTR